MKLSKTQTRAINAYAGFVDAGMTYGQAMREVAKELGDTPCITFLEGLAKVHADKYKCNYTMSAQGTFTFHTGEESTRETRDMGAFQSWRRNVMVWFTPTKPKAKKTSPRLAPDTRQAAKDYLAQFDSLADAIAALRAVAPKAK